MRISEGKCGRSNKRKEEGDGLETVKVMKAKEEHGREVKEKGEGGGR